MMILSALSGMVYALMLPFNMIEPGPYMARARVVIVWLMYVPALVMVLRRPNVREP